MQKKYIILLSAWLLLIGLNNVAAQNPQVGRGGLITGIVVNSTDNTPMEYAYIILYSEQDSAQIAGTVSAEDGRFLLKGIRPGSYYLNVNYMGFESLRIPDLRIGRASRRIYLSEIKLKESLVSTDKIEVIAEKPAMTYLIDKKVINVSQHQTAISGTAVDVLENIPSVTVDIEGNVSLRGSSSFLVLLDNIPTVLEPSEVLQQIPASAIEDIEIITNPSAKFDPDGTAGIINIITKKDQLNGVSGIVNLNLGLNDKYGVDFLLNYRFRKFNIYFGADYNSRRYSGTTTEDRWIRIVDTTFIHSDGSSDRDRNRYGFKGGMDYSITSKDYISLGFRYGGRVSGRESELEYEEWINNNGVHRFFSNRSTSERSGDFLAVNLNYRRQFLRKGHELIGQVIYHQRESDEESKDEQIDTNGQIVSGRKTTEQGPSSPLRLKLDYTLPLGEKNRFEAGYQSRFGRSEDITGLYDYDPLSAKYELKPEFNSKIEYKRNIYALYGMYSGEHGSFGYQGGMRGEYTDRQFKLINQDASFVLERWDFFPTLHFSNSFSKDQQMMVSYTRRIERPRGYYFEPFDTWMDAYNVRRGNPELKPEYIDSYELGYQKLFGRSIFSIEAYFRQTNNKIERVRTVDSTITVHTFDNVGADYTFGSELMLNTDLFKLWNVNLMGNLYHYRIEGDLLGRDFSRKSFNWSLRFNNTFRFRKSTRLQANVMYNSPSVFAQGRREGYAMLNLGLRQEFLNRALSATLQIRDVLQTAKHEFISEGENFYSHSKFKREAPIVMLNISYKLHNYEEKRKRGDNDTNGDEDDF